MLTARCPEQPRFGVVPFIPEIGAYVGGKISSSISGAGGKAPIPPLPASWQPSAFDPKWIKATAEDPTAQTYRADPVFQQLQAAYTAATGFPAFGIEEFLDARVSGFPDSDTSRKYVWTRVQENIRDRGDSSGLQAANAILDYFRPAASPSLLTAGIGGGGGGILPLVAIAATLLLLGGKKR